MPPKHLTLTTKGFVRNLGYKKSKDGTTFIQHKFYLGFDEPEALARMSKLLRLWKTVEESHQSRPGRPTWTEEMLAVGVAVAKGQKTPIQISKGDYEPPDRYYARINDLRRITEVPITPTPAHDTVYQLGYSDLESDITHARQQLSAALGTDRPATGQRLFDAMREYQKWLWDKYSPPNGLPTDSGKKRHDQIRSIRQHIEDMDLGELDYRQCERLISYFRNRPPRKKHKGDTPTRIKYSTSSDYIAELIGFFNWLHVSSQYEWKLPEHFQTIDRRPVTLDEDIEHDSAPIRTWKKSELILLNRYALPIERVFLLLGLNCAYGADQAGRLTLSEITPTKRGTSHIKRTRRKQRTRSRHILWEQTADAIEWAKARRDTLAPAPDNDVLMLTEAGTSFWEQTKGGNRRRSIPNLWKRLIKRIQKDHPDFRFLPFNSLRDTSASLVRRYSNGEVASLHLAHRHQSDDRNLRRYANANHKLHFLTLRRLERKLRSVFQAGGEDPWGKKKRNYIGLDKVRRINELRSQGVSVARIAKDVSVSIPTVYRHLDRTSIAQKKGDGGDTR